MMKKNTSQPYALITGGTSGVGQEMISIFKDKHIPVIITGSTSSDAPQQDGVTYIHHDQRTNDNLAEKIKPILEENNAKLAYVFLNAGKLHSDVAEQEKIQEMHTINHTNTVKIIQDLLHTGLIDSTTRIVGNASIQALKNRELTAEYGKSKKNLSNDLLKIQKDKHLDISILGHTITEEKTKIIDELVAIYAKEKFNGDKKKALAFIEALPQIPTALIKELLNDLFFSNQLLHNFFQKGKFFPLDNTETHKNIEKNLPISYTTTAKAIENTIIYGSLVLVKALTILGLLYQLHLPPEQKDKIRNETTISGLPL